MAIVELLLLLAVLMMAVALRSIGGVRASDLITSYNVVIGLFALYICFPSALVLARDGRFSWAPMHGGSHAVSGVLQVAIISLISFVIGYFAVWARRESQDAGNSGSDGMATPTIVLLLLTGIGLTLKTYFIVSTGGFDSAIFRLSNGIEESMGISSLSALEVGIRNFSTVGDAGALILAMQAIKNRNFVGVSVFLLVVVLAFTYLITGKRYTVVIPVLAMAIAVHYYRKRITIRTAPIAALILVSAGMATLLFRILLPARFADVEVDLNQIDYAQGSLLAFYFYSAEFSAVEMIALVSKEREWLVGMLGGPFETLISTNITPLAYSIPRAIWPGKPSGFLDLSYAIVAFLNGVSLDGATAGYASTLIGTSLAIADIPGVVIAFLVFGLVCASIDRYQLRMSASVNCYRLFALALVLSLVFHFFRQGTVGWTFIVGVVQHYGLIFGVAIAWVFRLSRPDPSFPYKEQLPQNPTDSTKASVKDD